MTGGNPSVTGDGLTDDEIGERLDDLDIWGVQFEKLATRVEFDDYGNAVEFANRVFDLAHDRSWKPEVKATGDAVEIDLWTPEVGITAEDFELAEDIEEELRQLDLE